MYPCELNMKIIYNFETICTYKNKATIEIQIMNKNPIELRAHLKRDHVALWEARSLNTNRTKLKFKIKKKSSQNIKLIQYSSHDTLHFMPHPILLFKHHVLNSLYIFLYLCTL